LVRRNELRGGGAKFIVDVTVRGGYHFQNVGLEVGGGQVVEEGVGVQFGQGEQVQKGLLLLTADVR